MLVKFPYSQNVQRLIIFGILLLIVLGFRLLILIRFGFKYTDSDQLIMWQGLKDYAEGNFYVPRFYGIAYNTMFESLMAVPLFKIGVPPYISLPLVTTLLALFPYLLFSAICFRKKNYFISFIILIIPLLMPLEYSFITSIPRGFVPSIFFASITCISIFYPQKKWGYFIVGFFGSIAFSVLPNSVILTIPCLFFMFLVNRKNISFYLLCGTGLLIGMGIHLMALLFYVKNPEYITHPHSFYFSFKLLISSLENLDPLFNNVTPIFWKQGFLILPFFVLTSIYFFLRKNLNVALFVLLVPILILFTTGVNKVHDWWPSIFFPAGRMYLGVPAMIGLVFIFINASKSKLLYLYFIIPFSLMTYNIFMLDSKMEKILSPDYGHIVTVNSVDWVLKTCEKFKVLSDQLEIGLIVIVNHNDYDIINYGCQVCDDDFPNSQGPALDRRIWRLREDKGRVYENILILTDRPLDEMFDYIEKVDENQFLIRNNQLPTGALLDIIGIESREI